MANQNDIAFRNASVGGEPVAGRAGVREDPLLGGLPFTSAITPVIEYQDGGIQPVAESLQDFPTISQVAAITVHEEHNCARLLRRREPAVERQAIGRLKPDVLNAGRLRPVTLWIHLRLKDESFFETGPDRRRTGI